MSTGARANLVEKVEEMTKKHKVVVFAKTYCPYCAQVTPMGDQINTCNVCSLEGVCSNTTASIACR